MENPIEMWMIWGYLYLLGNLRMIWMILQGKFDHDLIATETWNQWFIREISPKWP